jgi:hypothetical protein
VDRPLTDAEIRELGYDLHPDGGWRLARPGARPRPRPGLCRACSKFDAAIDGVCWGCLYFSYGDPHGVNVDTAPPAANPRQRSLDDDLVARVRKAAREVLGG